MNRTSRTDEPYGGEGLNQSPSPFSSDLTTNEDFNGRANRRHLRIEDPTSTSKSQQENTEDPSVDDRIVEQPRAGGVLTNDGPPVGQLGEKGGQAAATTDRESGSRRSSRSGAGAKTAFHKAKHAILTFGRFVGPGFMISVAYSELPDVTQPTVRDKAY